MVQHVTSLCDIRKYRIDIVSKSKSDIVASLHRKNMVWRIAVRWLQ